MLTLANADVFANEQMQAANRYYESEEFALALKEYKSVLEESLESEVLYYNLANTYYRLGEIGKSILYYEKTLKLNPSFKDAQHNLQLAYLASVDNVTPIPELFFVTWWKILIGKRSADQWAKRGLLFLWLSCFSLAAYFIAKKKLWKRLSIFLIVICFSFFFLSWQKNQYDRAHTFAIVLIGEASIKNAPSTEAKTLIEVHEGLKVSILDELDGWVEVKLEDGNIGWLDESALGII